VSESLRIVGFASEIDLAPGAFRVRADFTVAAGERVALFSPSGSGKTTLLRWIAGVSDTAATGKIFFGSRLISELPPEKREIGVVFQDYALFPNLSARENVAFGLEMRGASAAERKERALEWLAKLGLAARAEIPAGLLSGGEKQRVALARALVWNPKALLLDEPFAALDLAHRKNAREVVKTLLEKTSIPTIFITHDAEDVARLATRTLEYSASDEGMTHTFLS
jgi:putative spermidine/putrescine transport system ATP-binding protein